MKILTATQWVAVDDLPILPEIFFAELSIFRPIDERLFQALTPDVVNLTFGRKPLHELFRIVLGKPMDKPASVHLLQDSHWINDTKVLPPTVRESQFEGQFRSIP